MPTGTPVTTVQSSLHCGLAYVALFLSYSGGVVASVPGLLSYRDPLYMPFKDRLEVVFASCGFSAKVKLADTWSDLTFLRGSWFSSLDYPAWLPLPSRVLKLGKSMEDPIKLLTKARMRLDGARAEAQRLALYAWGKTLGDVPRDYPILGPFLAAFDRLGTNSAIIVEDNENPYRPVVAGVSHGYNADRAAHGVCARYGLSFSDLVEWESLCQSIDNLPAVVSHPLLKKLVEVDY